MVNDEINDTRDDEIWYNITSQEVKEHIKEYGTLLDSNAPEEHIHQFLATHTYFFNGIVRVFSGLPIYSKVKLGAEYEMDFCYMDPNSSGPEWNLIEIERPGYKLFTKSGNQTKELTHAIGQVQKWHDWIDSNKSYAEKLMPLIKYQKGIVVIGRQSEVINNSHLKNRLKRINYDYRGSIEVRTFDSLLRAAESILYLANKNEGSHNLNIPKTANSHSDLKNGLPKQWDLYLTSHSKNGDLKKFNDQLAKEEKQNLMDTDFDSFYDTI